MFDYNQIAFYTSLKQSGRSRIGHLWMFKGGWSDTPMYYGAPSQEFHEHISELLETDEIEHQQLEFGSQDNSETSASILASLFRKLGVIDIKASKLRELEFSVVLELVDYQRLSVPPAAFNSLIGQRIPAIAGTGRWVIAFAQHEASQGRFSLTYNKQQARSLGLDLAARGSASLNFEGEKSSAQLYSFKASEAVVFGVSVIQLVEAQKKWSKFGDKHKGVRFVHS